MGRGRKGPDESIRLILSNRLTLGPKSLSALFMLVFIVGFVAGRCSTPGAIVVY